MLLAKLPDVHEPYLHRLDHCGPSMVLENCKCSARKFDLHSVYVKNFILGQFLGYFASKFPVSGI